MFIYSWYSVDSTLYTVNFVQDEENINLKIVATLRNFVSKIFAIYGAFSHCTCLLCNILEKYYQWFLVLLAYYYK